MNIDKLLEEVIEKGASDFHISVGVAPTIRINGELEKIGEEKITPKDSLEIVKNLLDDEEFKLLEEKGEIDTSLSKPGLGRFRVNAYKQRDTFAISLRTIPISVPTIEELKLPDTIKELSLKKRGLILVTGPTGSGKSTTLASMIDYINENRNCHILTLEDPIEYLHNHNKSIVNQREIGRDSKSFSNALRASLRQDPDVILVGEMRDLETISIAVTAAETGHLVLSTLHTNGASNTIDRIIDVFPPHQQQQIRTQLSGVLEGIISQQLLPKIGGGRTAALEILTATPAIRNLIREGKNHQIQSTIQTGARFGMQTMDSSLRKLFDERIISEETAVNFSYEKSAIKKKIRL